VYYRSWTSAGGWSAEATGPSMGGTDVAYSLKLYADPYSNSVMLGVQDNGQDLNFVAWDGSAWGTVSTLDSNTNESYRENFAFAWTRDTPTISNLQGDTLAYTEGGTAAVIDQGGNGSVASGDGQGYDTGNLTVTFAAGSTASEDVLSIHSQGTGTGQISVSGANVSYEGVVIGTYSGGSGGAALVVAFNSRPTRRPPPARARCASRSPTPVA